MGETAGSQPPVRRARGRGRGRSSSATARASSSKDGAVRTASRGRSRKAARKGNESFCDLCGKTEAKDLSDKKILVC